MSAEHLVQLNLAKLRECALLTERAAVEDNPHHAFAYARWIRFHAEELLYEDLWQEPEEPPEPQWFDYEEKKLDDADDCRSTLRDTDTKGNRHAGVGDTGDEQ